MKIEKINIKTETEFPSIEIFLEDGVSYKFSLKSGYDEWKVKGKIDKNRDKENFIELNKSYHRCFGKGYDKKKFLRMMKKDLLERFSNKKEESKDETNS